MQLTLQILDGNLVNSSLKRGTEYRVGTDRYYSPEKLSNKILDKNRIEDNCKYFHGIAVYEDEKKFRIYNDPFCSHPLYAICVSENKIVFTTQFQEVFHYPNLHMDNTGIYELLCVGGFLYDRTIIKEVKQLPAASYCEIEKATMNYRITSYYNFDISEDETISSQKRANEAVYACLKNIWSEFKGKEILMGLSGGLDSRLSACLLSEYVGAENVKFFTFGYSKHIQEYIFAKRVAKELDYHSPEFVKLTYDDYKDAEKLAVKTGAHVGMGHGHTYESLKQLSFDKKNTVFISNYYSDAVMGWDAKKEKLNNECFEDLELYKEIKRNQDKLSEKLRGDIIEEALNDLKKIWMRYDSKANFSCFDEYYYVTERNPKFHLRSAYQCNDVLETEIPFADFDLLRLCISIPLEYRWEKKIEREIISQYYFDLKDISSRRYFERSKIGEQSYSFTEKVFYLSGVVLLRAINFINLILAKVSDSRVQIINPYQTENQRIMFDRHFKGEFVSALNSLAKTNILKKECLDSLKKTDFRSSKIPMKYSVIDLANIMKKLYNLE